MFRVPYGSTFIVTDNNIWPWTVMWQGKTAASRSRRQPAIFFGKIKLHFWGKPRSTHISIRYSFHMPQNEYRRSQLAEGGRCNKTRSLETAQFGFVHSTSVCLFTNTTSPPQPTYSAWQRSFTYVSLFSNVTKTWPAPATSQRSRSYLSFWQNKYCIKGLRGGTNQSVCCFYRCTVLLLLILSASWRFT